MNRILMWLLLAVAPLVLSAQNEAPSPQHPSDTARITRLDSLLVMSYLDGNLEQALQYGKEAVALCSLSLGEYHLRCGRCLNNLGFLQQDLVQYRAAERNFKRAILISRREKAAELLGDALNNLAGLYEVTDRFASAIPLYREALDITEQLFGKDHREYVKSLNNLAGSLLEVGRYTEAEIKYRSALGIAEGLEKDQRGTLATLLNNLGLFYLRTGQAEEALPVFLRSAEMTAAIEGDSSIAYGIRLDNLANAYYQLGQYDKALSYAQKAVENARKNFAADNPECGVALNNLATVYKRLGRYDEALEIYQEVLAIFENSFGKDNLRSAITLINLAAINQNKGNNQEALALQQASLEITAGILGTEHAEYGKGLLNLAAYQIALGEYEPAIDTSYRALEIIRRAIGEDNAYFGNGLQQMAWLFEATGQSESALMLSRKAHENARLQLRRTFGVLSESGQSQFLETLQELFHQQFSFAYRHAAQHPRWGELALDNALLLKNLLLQNAQQLVREVRGSGKKEWNDKLERWQATRQRLARYYGVPRDQLTFDLDSLLQVAEYLESDLALASRSFAAARREVRWQDVQRELSEGEAVIEFIHFPYHRRGRTDSTFYAALVLRSKDPAPHFVPLFEETALKEMLNVDAENSRAYVEKVYQPELYELIWAPLDSLLAGATAVYYSPSGLLHRLNFSVLPRADGRPLADAFPLYFVSTARSLLTPRAERARHWEEAWVYGGIDYEWTATPAAEPEAEPTEEVASRGRTWRALPKTLAEARRLETLLSEEGVEVRTFTGRSATEESVKALQTDEAPDVLHFGTHGFFFPQTELNNLEQQASLQGGRYSFRYAANPLLRSGLVLAGGNHVWREREVPAGREDGILTAYEIANLDLSGTQLVVLSACESGLGDIRNNEGVYGLQRAFKLAGVEYLIVSLWNIPDSDETVAFMERFFKNYRQLRLPIREAFRLTQQQLRKRNDHPYFWGAFLLIE